jgi:hypothetical protein
MTKVTRFAWPIPVLENGELGYSTSPEPDPDPEDPTDHAASTEGGAVQVAYRALTVLPADDVNFTDGTVTDGGGSAGVFSNPQNTNDGDGTSSGARGGFAAGAGTYESILQTDLGAAFEVTDVVVFGSHAFGSDPEWVVEHSADGSTGWTVATNTYVWDGIGLVARMELDTPTTERYWRIVQSVTIPGLQFVSALQVNTWSITGAGTTLGDTQWFPAPAANDGDTATSAYSNVTADPTLRVYLLAARAINRISLDIGTETAGATVFEFYGSEDAAFTSPVLLATLSLTATGSYTLDSVEESWTADAIYAFFQLEHVSGGGDDREFYEVHLYSAVDAVGVSDHPSLTGRSEADQHPASSVTVTDAAGWTTATNVETFLADLAGKTIGYLSHGNTGATETFDAAYGYHSATLDNNCTATLTAAPTGTVSSLFLELTQDGTGGRTFTLPASVVNKTDIEADQDTTAGETTFLLLLSRDGGTNWYGQWWGGDSGSGSLADIVTGYEAHGNMGATETFDAATGWHSGTFNANCTFTLTANASGTVSSLFLELTQDGTGGWTITLPASVTNKADLEADQVTTLSTTSFLVLLSRDGGTTWYGGWWGSSGGGASDLDDLTDVVITAPALDDDLRYDGSFWVNDSRKWEIVTDGEDVLVWESDDLVYEWSA